MKSLKESFINKSNINKIHSFERITKKENLKTGDLCLLNSGDIGVYIEDPDFEEFDIYENDQPSILFYEGTVWTYLCIRDYDENLKDEDGDTKYDCIKVIRGTCDPKITNNSKKLCDFFIKNDLKNFF